MPGANRRTFDYLVIAGAKAQFKGFGKINGVWGYDFILTVIDGALAGDGVDKFRIKIWEKNTGEVIYDNEPGRSDADDPITPVGEASSVIIKIHAGSAVATRHQEWLTRPVENHQK